MRSEYLFTVLMSYMCMEGRYVSAGPCLQETLIHAEADSDVALHAIS